MNTSVLDGLVTNYQHIIEVVSLPDPDDRHVLAAAIKCGAGVIVTRNLKHFPLEALDPYGIEARHPDEFVADLFDLDPAAFCTALKTLRARLRKPAVSAEDSLKMLKRQGLAESVACLRDYVELI